MSDRDAVAEVAADWLRRSQVDLRIAQRLNADRESIEPWAAAFHAQQSAEKCIKAALVIEQTPFPRTHELERLAALLGSEWNLPDAKRLAGFSRFAVAGRYPEGMIAAGHEPDWADADEAITMADHLCRTVREGMRQRDMDAPDKPEGSDGS